MKEANSVENMTSPVSGNSATAPVPTATATASLRSNRAFKVLWRSQFLSEFSGELLAAAAPLLVLLAGGSDVQVGLAMSAATLALALFSLPAGAVADRFPLRTVLLVAQGGRLLLGLSLLVALLTHHFVAEHLMAVLFLEGVLAAFFGPAEHASLTRVVDPEQLQQAIAVNVGRPFVAALVAPTLAGFAFDIAAWLPLAFFAALLVITCSGLLSLHIPATASGADEDEHVELGGVWGAVQWATHQPRVLRSLLWMLLANFVFHALVVVVVLATTSAGGSGGAVGVVLAGIGVGGVCGGLLAPVILGRSSPRQVMVGLALLVASAVGGVFLWYETPAVVAAFMACSAFLAPAMNALIMTDVLTAAPAGMQGRASSAAALAGYVSGAAGPIVAGCLMSSIALRPTLTVLAGLCALLVILALPLRGRATGVQGPLGTSDDTTGTADATASGAVPPPAPAEQPATAEGRSAP